MVRQRASKISVAERDHEIRFTVRDNGSGFDPSVPASGFGLGGMRERITLTGGTLEITSSDEGTVVAASVPASRTVRESQTAQRGG